MYWAYAKNYFIEISDISIDLKHAWNRIYTVSAAQPTKFFCQHILI